jgi:hypothetical protein
VDQFQSRVQGFLLASAILVIGFLVWRHTSAIELLAVERGRSQELIAMLDKTQGERDEVIGVVNRLPPVVPFFEGTDVWDSAILRLERPVDGVFYLVRVTCPFCGANDSALHEIAAASIPVFVIGLDSDIPSLREWVNDHGLSARAFVDVSGSFVERLPTKSVPRTVVVRAGAIRLLITGKLDSAATRMIIDSVGRT